LAKLLILGCSYTRGSYAFNSNGDEELVSNKAWLDNLPGEIVYYTGWGIGYINWVDIIESIELDTFDAVILQESVEPKFQLTKDVKWNETRIASEFRPPITRYELDIDSIVFSRGLKHRTHLQKQLHLQDMRHWQWIDKIDNNDSVLNLTKACVSHVNNKLQQHNIPGYIIRTHEYVDYANEHTHCKYLDLDPLFTIVGNDKQLVNTVTDGGQGHFTEKGNNLLAQHVMYAWIRRDK